MNLALIHDKYAIKGFWERKIENHCRMTMDEMSRANTSALNKLREEWTKRLDIRVKHLKKAHEENMRRAKPEVVEDQA